jgi:glyoxylate/hydroxypyruvate reductase A
MSVALITPNRSINGIQSALIELMGEENVQVWPKIERPEEVVMAVTWDHPDGIWDSFENLKAVVSLGAGADHLIEDNTIPDNLKLGRVVTPTLKQQMAEFILMHVLWIQRKMPLLRDHQLSNLWKPEPPYWKRQLPVGILGMGELGTAAARLLVENGFTVNGWSRTSKTITDVTSYAGVDALDEMIGNSRILICLLPLTEQTKCILNQRSFDQLNDSGWLIHVGRGEHLQEEDLLQALDSGQLNRAFLDVFPQEPLPSDHPFWSHPDIYITPHIASLTPPDEAAQQLADDYQRLQDGGPLKHPVQRELGY